MIDLYTNRVLKSLDQNIKLIYYEKEKEENFEFYVLGTSGYIYNLNYRKNSICCNCEDYKNIKYCKHISFILFKVLKVFKLTKKFELKLIGNNSLINSKFLNNLNFNDFEWFIFKLKFSKIKLHLKSLFFNIDNFNKFKMYKYRLNFFIKPRISEANDKCAICLESNSYLLKCQKCSNEYHVECIIEWFRISNNRKCPICSSACWDDIYVSLLIFTNKLIPMELLKKN